MTPDPQLVVDALRLVAQRPFDRARLNREDAQRALPHAEALAARIEQLAVALAATCPEGVPLEVHISVLLEVAERRAALREDKP